MADLLNLKVSLERLESFLLTKELNNSYLVESKRASTTNLSEEKPAVQIKHGFF